MEYRVILAGLGLEGTVGGGTVAEACARLGHPLELVCGGNGRCGKCAVTVERGGVRERVRACATNVDSDMAVYLSDGPDYGSARILTDSDEVLSFSPAVAKELCPDGSLTPEHCGAFFTGVPLPVLRRFARVRRDHPEEALTLVRFEGRLLDAQPGDTTARLYGCAVDIGTTTVAMYVYDLRTGALLDTVSALNGQIGRGADVIARIQYTLDSEDGLRELNRDIVGTINGLLARAEKNVPGLRENLYHLVFCGNSTMQHLFLGLEPAALGVDPFANITADWMTVTAEELGLSCPAGAAVEYLPLLGGFVGADTTAVLLGVPEDGVYLAVDLGTNGEIAVGNNRTGFFTASTACGPALEGGNIDCGMRGTDGAIDRLRIRPDGEIEYHVLGGGEAQGLCGSGIIDAVAEMLRQGLIDETGRLLPAADFGAAHPGSPLTARLSEQGPYNTVFALTAGERPVYLSQKDVRQIQLAKSSICAGCLTLAEERGIRPGDVDALILAGAFGNYIDIENALYIGLLPPVPAGKIRAVGNGAGRGARMCLLDRANRGRCLEIQRLSRHVELNASPVFMDKYIDNMNFLP